MRGSAQNPWDEDLGRRIARFSTNQEYAPYDLTEELERRGLFQPCGVLDTQPVPFAQSGEDYIRSLHSMNGLSRERMGEQSAEAFDREVRRVLAPYLHNGQVRLSVVSRVVWGLPQEL